MLWIINKVFNRVEWASTINDPLMESLSFTDELPDLMQNMA